MKKELPQETKSVLGKAKNVQSEYWLNRSFEEIMKDYEEQSSEWELQLVTKDGETIYKK